MNKNLKGTFISILIFSIVSNVFGMIYFDDGQNHPVDYVISEQVVLFDSPTLQPTSVTLLDGGSIDSLVATGNSHISIYGGQTSILLFDTSVVEMFGGSVDKIDAISSNSEITISGGTVETYIYASNDSIVDISGGIILETVGVYGRSTLYLSGGVVGDVGVAEESQAYISGGTINSLFVTPSAIADISGGIINGFLEARGDANIIIHGTDFSIDGFNVSYGLYQAANFSEGTLQGTLLEGDMLDCDFNLYDNSSILLVPEPATMLLLAVGGMLLRRRK